MTSLFDKKKKNNVIMVLSAGVFLGFNLILLITQFISKSWIAGIMFLLETVILVGLYITLFKIKYKTRDISEISIDIMNDCPESVMIIVPHPDDELNIAGILIRNMLLLKKTVYIVFSSNFDAYGNEESEKRYKEVNKLYSYLGIPLENIFYLGFPSQHYFDQNEEKKYIDNDKMYCRQIYKNVSKYINENDVEATESSLIDQIVKLIDIIRPELVVGVDRDSNIDHIFLSDAIDKALENIKGLDDRYHPKVFKGFSYATSWMGRKDFYYNINVEKTLQNFNGSSELDKYKWDQRIRIPYLQSSDLGLSLRSSLFYKLYSFYSSQNALSHMNQLVNSDEVFWEIDSNPHIMNEFIKFINYDSGNYVYHIFLKKTEIVKIGISNIYGERKELNKFQFSVEFNNKEIKFIPQNNSLIMFNSEFVGNYKIKCYLNCNCIDSINISVISEAGMKALDFLRKYEKILDWYLLRLRYIFYKRKRKNISNKKELDSFLGGHCERNR